MFVIPDKTGVSGASLAIIYIIQGLVNKAEVYVLATKPSKDHQVFLNKLKQKGAHLFLVDSDKSGLAFWKSLRKKAMEIINENQIEIVHLHLPRLVYFLGKELKKQNKKLVFTAEGDPIYETEGLGIKAKLYTKLMWKKCKEYPDVVCPCSNWLADRFRSRDKMKNIVPIHNAIDLERFNFTKSKKELLKNSKNEFVILTTARLTQVKGLDVLLRSFAEFSKRNEANARLVILGEGELKNNLENLADELGVKEMVSFLGFKNNPQDFMISSDVFVMTSNYEPFGMPAAESGAMGIPTIVSKPSGMAEIIIHGETGYHFEVGDYHGLSLFLEKFYKEPELAKKFGEKAKEHIVKNFAPDIIGEKYFEVYSKLLK